MMDSRYQAPSAGSKHFALILIGLATLSIFVIDLYVPLGFAPWLPYFVLAFGVSRLNQPRLLLLSTVFWSVAIMGEPLLRQHTGTDLPIGVFNRSVGTITLWILAGLLFLDMRTRLARQNSESRLQAIVQGALDAVVTMDRQGIVVEWNPQAEVMFGYSRRDAMGRLLADLIIPAEYRDAHTKGMQRFLSTGEEKILRRRIEVTAIRKNGDVFPVELTVIPLHLGEQTQFSSFIRDITARSQSERQLQESTAFIESMFENLPTMVFVKDAADLRFVRINKAGETLLGYSRSELLGKNDYDFFPRAEADFFTAMDRETLSKGILVDIQEEPIQTRSNGPRLLHTKKIPLHDSGGTPRYLLGISEDITARKEAEAALLAARLSAEEAIKAKSEFLATVSHEMRTPLNAIVGIAEYLARTPLSPEQQILVTRCTKASDGLLRMIEDLLLAAKAGSGTLEIVQEPFQLPEVVSECTMLLSPEAQDKGLSLTLHLEPNLPCDVVGDADRLQQVLLNLIRNAIKFTHSGTIDVRVSPLLGEGHNCKVQFSVSDTGIGISPEQQTLLFQRFAQADSKSNRQFGGVGLGLSICKQLVELMRGRIWVDSRKGYGSTFSFILPLTVVSNSAAHPPSKGSPSAAEPTAEQETSRSLRILLAEDSVESQEVMRLYLRSTPHQLDIASTGTRAVTRFKEQTYDVVFMDLNMPEIDGFTATKLIRAWEAEQKRRQTPIVALTANGLLETQQESAKAGCNGFVTKPIKMDMLLQAIQKYADDPAQASLSPTDADRVAAQEMAQLKLKFLRNRYHDMSTLRTAVAQEHFDQIRTIGHRIKGLAGSYGLHEIGTIGSILEQAAIDRNASAITTQITKLREAVLKAETTAQTDTGLSSHAA